MSKSIPKKSNDVKLYKIPVVLEEFLFRNPDTALAFMELTLVEKNTWTSTLKKCKTQPVLEKFLFEMKQTLEKQS